MDLKNYILQSLHDGSTPESVAEVLVNTLNEAIAEFEDSQKEAEKKTAARNLVETINAFAVKYYGEKKMTEEDKTDAADALIEAFDSIIAVAEALKKENGVSNFLSKGDDDIIKGFLDSLG